MKDHTVDIFQPYQQLQRKQNYKGSSTGLAICQKIIEQHGGSTTYDSRYGTSSIFYFTIPKAKIG